MNNESRIKKIIRSLKFAIRTSGGVTLVELLLYMGLLSIFLLVLTQLFLSVLDVSSESNQVSAVSQDGKFILTRLSYDLRRADSISTPVLGATGSTLILNIAGSTYTYAISGANLTLSVSGQAIENINSPNSQISSLTFTQIGNPGGKNTVQIIFTIVSKATDASGPEQLSFQTTVGLR